MLNRDVGRAIIAQAIIDASYILRDKNYRKRRYEERPTPTRLESFQAWRWLFDPKASWDRDLICELAGFPSDELVEVFSSPGENTGKITTLTYWARQIIRQP